MIGLEEQSKYRTFRASGITRILHISAPNIIVSDVNVSN